MTTATATPTWPTEATYEEAGVALAAAFGAVEALDMDLDRILRPYMDKGEVVAGAPTAATIGQLWAFLDLLKNEILSLTGYAASIEESLGQANDMRIEEGIRAR